MVVPRLISPWFGAFLAGSFFLAFPAATWARKGGVAINGCTGCHQGGKEPTVKLAVDPMNPPLGQPATITVTVSQTNGPVAGFYLTTDDLNMGTFQAIESGTAASTYGVTHTTPRTGAGGVTTFKAQWSAKVATGVTFAAYALSANGDGSPGGDLGGEAHLSIATGCTPTTYYIDEDADGYGTSDPSFAPHMACTQPAGYSAKTGDCNDFNEKIYPGAPELCDGKDNNCDGKIDESVSSQIYCEDKDGDGHGVPGGATKTDCIPSVGFGDCNGDCNDQNKTIYPGAPELCDQHDNNCNGMVDEGVRKTCGVGWCRRYADGCSSSCTPGQPIAETCNFFDDDCDGVVDNGTDAELCGASGLVCVVGKCMPGENGGGMGQSGGMSPVGTGATGVSPAGGGGGTTGVGGGPDAGAGSDPASGGGNPRGGGCVIGDGDLGGGATTVCLAICTLLIGIASSRVRRRGKLRKAEGEDPCSIPQGL